MTTVDTICNQLSLFTPNNAYPMDIIHGTRGTSRRHAPISQNDYTTLESKSKSYSGKNKKTSTKVEVFVFALPIFPGSHPPSIVGVHVLNFCVRDGNRWTHMTINTNYLVTHTGFEPMLTA